MAADAQIGHTRRVYIAIRIFTRARARQEHIEVAFAAYTLLMTIIRLSSCPLCFICVCVCALVQRATSRATNSASPSRGAHDGWADVFVEIMFALVRAWFVRCLCALATVCLYAERLPHVRPSARPSVLSDCVRVFFRCCESVSDMSARNRVAVFAGAQRRSNSHSHTQTCTGARAKVDICIFHPVKR